MTGQTILNVEEASKRFGGIVAVAGLSFSVEPGQVLGIIGPNGAGKSTTFDLISGFRRPDSGRIVFYGDSIVGLEPHKVAQLGMARSFQHAKISEDLSIDDIFITAALIRLGMREAREASREMLEKLNLTWARDQRTSQLSLPDRQMVEFGRCMITQPRLVLLDEIMAGLTLKEAEKPIAIIKDCCKSGVAFIIVEHLMPIIASACDLVVAMDFGSQVAIGTPEQVLQDPHVRATYLGTTEQQSA